MAKTGRKAQFSLGEQKVGSVIMPAQFVTAKTAKSKGYHYEKLVDYAKDENKVSEKNNMSVVEETELIEQFQSEEGYATRPEAVTEKEPILGPDKLNYNNHDISMLRQRLTTAQNNGNNVHEIAFSMRGDWLVENNLFDPNTGMLDQTKLKHAEQAVVNTLIEEGLPLPLGESADDVVWFGVIHQDTDHLNIHLWFAKVSKETRPEMIIQEGQYRGEPRGELTQKSIDKTLRHFRNELMSVPEREKRIDILKEVGALKKDILSSGMSTVMSRPEYLEQLSDIYNALPPENKGRWQVGNTNLKSTNSKMASANHLVDSLLTDLFKNELNDVYSEYQKYGKRYDQINIEDKGFMQKGQKSWSENKEAELRKNFANKLYRYMNDAEIEKTTGFIDRQMAFVKKDSKQYQEPKSSQEPKKSNQGTKEARQGEPIQQKKNLPVYMPRAKVFNSIAKAFRKDIRADMVARNRYLKAQANEEFEKAAQEQQSMRHRL